VTVSGRLVALGYGTFIVIVFASFTAETASYVIKKQMEKTIDSLEAALRNGNSICFSTGMSLMAETKYDRFAKLGVEIDSFYFSEYASAMDTGLCDFALVANRLLTDEWERGESCNFKIVGGPVLSFPVGYWVSHDLYRRIGWAATTQCSSGNWGKIQNEFKTQSICKQHSSSSSRRLQSTREGHEFFFFRASFAG